MALYKYVTSATAKRILKGSIRFTQPSAFNDPFELLPQFITPENFAPDSQSISFCLRSPRRKGINRSNNSELDRYKSDLQARQIVKSLNGAIGILCLSRNPESLLMWGHYADSYAGAVIEFDESHDFFTGGISVKYQKKRPVFDINDFHGCNVPISDLCVKPNVWAYEREVRLIRKLSDCSIVEPQAQYPIATMDVPLECISGVIIGERMTIENQKALWELVKNTPISLSLAAVANWDYSFRNETIKHSGPLVGSPVISPRTASIFKDEPGELGQSARWIIENHPLSKHMNVLC